MATKSMIVSGMGVALALVQGLVDAVKKAGGDDDDIHRLVTPEGESLLAKFASMVVGIKRQAFKIIVDYSLSLAEMISAGNYNWSNSDITADHFPIKGEGKCEREVVLLHFNRVISTEEALKEMDEADYRPATIEELLALGASQKELQREFPIVALGSVWRSPGGCRSVPCLRRSGSLRCLDLCWLEFAWDGAWRFAVVRK